MIGTRTKIQSLVGVSQPLTNVSHQSNSVPTQMKRSTSERTAKFVLVIDNSPTIQRIVEMVLSREGYELECFSNGIDALKWLMSPDARTPDIMLVDLTYSKSGGLELIQQCRSKERFIRTDYVILSRSDAIVDRLKARLVGAAAYITKPFTTQELVTVVCTLIANQTTHGESDQ